MPPAPGVGTAQELTQTLCCVSDGGEWPVWALGFMPVNCESRVWLASVPPSTPPPLLSQLHPALGV